MSKIESTWQGKNEMKNTTTTEIPCPACKGVGAKSSRVCPTCNGHKTITPEQSHWYDVGKKCKDIRRAMKLTVKEACVMLNADPDWLLKTENGRRNPERLLEVYRRNGAK